MVFPNGGPQPRHPSQLYEAGLEGVVLFIILMLVVRRGGLAPRRASLSGLFGLGYGLSRIAVEFLREPDAQVGYLYGGWLTMGMLLSLPVAVAGAALVWYALRQTPAPLATRAARNDE